jgi:uncharacterized membrane protein YsdA (DUF1294 family)/cold shock CspA family protein
MRSRTSPRYQGKVSSWKDDQGFGFITPNGGGPAVFVHIKSFAIRQIRPAVNDIVTYHLTVNGKGQPRAENVAFVRDRVSRRISPRTGAASLFAAVGFFGVLAVAVLAGRLPVLIVGLYSGVSAIAFIAYALDKSAARNNGWRTPESTLHMLALAGGWPGALCAQQLLRHKSSKQAFQITFCLTVIVNCIALGWLLSASGFEALRTLLVSP